MSYVTADFTSHLYITGEMYVPQKCGPDNKIEKGPGYFTVTATGGTWPTDGVCTVYDAQPIPAAQQGGSYIVSAQVNSVKGHKDGIKMGHPGIMYNAKDSNNYDLLYFR